MNKIYRVLVIGCGHIGEEHLMDIYYRNNIRIVAVVDNNIQRAELLAKKYGVTQWGTSYLQFLDSEKVDITIIATYASTHLAILKDCIDRGIHVLCEKPFAQNLVEAQEFVNISQKANIKVLIGHILRHNATYQKVAEMIHNGAIGAPIVMRMVQNHHTMDWERYKRLLKDCSPILDCGVHYFDVMQWFTGEKIIKLCGVKSVIDDDSPEDSYNYGIVTAKLSGGSVGYYEAGWSNTLASGNLKEFIGPKGRISIVLSEQRLEHREEGDLIEYFSFPQNEYKSINFHSAYKPMYRQLMNLIGMIEGHEPPCPTMNEAFSSFEAAWAADTALRTESIVTLPSKLALDSTSKS